MNIKKLNALLLLPALLIFFSCASTPKTQEKIPPQEAENSLAEQEEQPETEPETEENGETDLENQEEAAEELPELEEERVIPDELEDLPAEIEVEPAPEEIHAPAIEEEPEVLDASEFSADEIAPQTGNSAESQEQAELKDDSKADSENSADTEETSDNSLDAGQTEADSAIETENGTYLEAESGNSDEAQEEETAPEEIKPSRSVSIPKNQFIDIYYPGKGWIYQGCIDEEGNIDSRNKYFVFGGRKLGGEDQCFTLRSRVPGKYLLHFFKNDGLTGNYIDDYLEVIVGDRASDSSEHITVPKYSEIIPPKVSITHEKVKEERKRQKEAEVAAENEKAAEEEKQIRKTASAQQKTSAPAAGKTEPEETVTTTIQTTDSAAAAQVPSDDVQKPVQKTSSKSGVELKQKEAENNFSDEKLEKMTEDLLLQAAQKLYDAKDYENALKAITKFFEKASKNIDKGLFLQGQILEEKSSVQNIKDAVESYDLLVKNYPASEFWDKAKKRSIYLRRFYINIR